MRTRMQKPEMATSAPLSMAHQEYSRILTAAVINFQFRQLLLTNPGKAIESGYGGESFYLAREEKKRVAEIRATSLADFASQLSQVLEHSPVAVSVGD